MTKCDWYYGPTGTGKSHAAFRDFDPLTTYVHNVHDHGWWDGYCGQETVIINELREEIPYGQILDLIDKNPCTVRRRCSQPTPFLAKKIIITSALSPRGIYKDQILSVDNIEQLMRRINLIKLTEVYKPKEEEVVGEGSVLPPPPTSVPSGSFIDA